MQGISVYSRAGRRHWLVAYDCPRRGKRINESSGIPLDDPRGKLAAYAYAREKSASGVLHGAGTDPSRWELWVETWLRLRFAAQPRTLTSYLGAWKFVGFWLRENKVLTPRALTYQHAVAFVQWRESQVKKHSRRQVSRNTALHNVKVLSRIMREAVRRGYAQGNPCFRLTEDVPPTKAPEKPEFTDAQIEAVRAELRRRDGLGRPSDWMAIAFEIALHTGCRISATQIPMERIDFENNTITFHEKGGEVFTAPIHPGLRPLLVRLRDEGRAVTCELPRFASRNFGRVLHSIGLPHTMHCARVTVISRLARSGVPEQQAMRYVHHANWATHKIYQRLKPADVRGCHAALVFPRAEPAPAPPKNQGAHRARPRPSRASSSGRKK
jgi:integrase